MSLQLLISTLVLYKKIENRSCIYWISRILLFEVYILRWKLGYHYKWVGVWGFISWRSGVISDSLRTSVWQTALQRQWGAVSRRRVYTTRYSQQANKVYMISCCWETVKWWKLSCPQHGESSSGVNQMLVWYTWLMTWDFMVFAQESHF